MKQATRSLVLRLGALVIVGLLSAAYIAFDVAGWRIGTQNYTVTVVLPRAGGIYTEAAVTYRGVQVGKVTSLNLRPTTVRVGLSIDPNVKIPSNVVASVRSLTAAGEQYMDLVPTKGDPPNLHNGSVITEGASVNGVPTVPVEVGTTLADAGALLNSVNTKDLQTITKTLSSGFSGTGDNLRTIVVAGQSLVNAFEVALPETDALVVNGNTLLQVLGSTDNAFTQFSASLNQLSGQLKASNGDFTSLLNNGLTVSTNTNQLLAQDATAIENNLASTATVTNVTQNNQAATAELFQVLPVFANDIGAVVSPSGQLRVELNINSSSPVCAYVPASQVPLPTQPVASANLNNGNSCVNSPITPKGIVRGAANTP